MTTINEKLGLKRAGKRAMMKLPPNRAAAARVTSAECPGCHRRGQAKASATRGPGWLFCRWCGEQFQVEEPA